MPTKMFLTEYKKYPLDYFVLFVFLITGLLAFLFESYLPFQQDQIIAITLSSYFLWSLAHHYRKKDLSLSIIIEYVALIALALVALLFNMLRA
jgi:FtsH-binding integral membrane protein